LGKGKAEKDESGGGTPSSGSARMNKKRFLGIAAAVLLNLLQAAFLVALAAKAVLHFLRILLDPHVRRGSVFLKFIQSLVLVGLACGFFIGLHVYNQLVDIRHFLEVAHGRLLVEMQRKQDVLSGCRNAVEMYAAMEEKIQDRLITLHRLTRAHGPGAPIVKSEGLELLNLLRELDLLVEKYPGLKSKGPYVLLMETIQETGLQVITERLNYNNWTYNYNVTCRLFPNNMVALVMGFKEQPFLQGPLDYSLFREN
jgi:LemA protein